jgi:hypothetical protein
MLMAQDKYMSSHKGKVAERNGAHTPFYHKVDFRFTGNIHKHRQQEKHSDVDLRLFNFLNLLNKNWGVRDFFVANTPLRATRMLLPVK